MNAALHVVLTRTFKREPLAVVDGLPGGYAELTPGQLRTLAAVLVEIAADCEARPMSTTRPLPLRKEYSLARTCTVPNALPGLWREAGGLDRLVILDMPALTAGMVVIARQGEDFQRRPELRWQAWPDDLARMTTC